MSSFYFSSVPKLKIRRGGVVQDISHPPPVPSATPDPGVTVLQTPEIMVGSPSFVLLAPEVNRKYLPLYFSRDPCLRREALDNRVRERQAQIAEMRHSGPPLLILLAGTNISTLGPAGTSWT
ncbi:hypothetical protein Fot_48206 [Forsythia ovata]|uniref:Uncharacterized protein n=1 Tax=Forsythia ovata TaxID=205694 RepID=A0ABD1QSK2_9LAMI